MLTALSLSGHELSVLLTSDAKIRILNRDFRSKDKPTDVLAFPMAEPGETETMPGLLGDVVISMETAREQALSQGRTILFEVTHLLAHGLLHLVGFDHMTDEETREMDEKTQFLLTQAVENSV